MTEETQEKKPLTRKQRVFIDEYLLSFNATAAAKNAGYSEKTAHAMGWENLRKPEIAAAIQARLAEVHMSADEALKLTADIARSDIGDLLNSFGGLDLEKARETGKTALIKKIKQRTITKIGKAENEDDVEIHDTEFEMYDRQAALRDILKINGKFIERTDITTNGKDITPKEDNARYDRAVTTLADAVREILSPKGNGQNSEVDTPK